MNERGFFTIVGLCLLLAVAISIRGVQEFEGNYSIGMTNAQAEFELQNFAESGIAKGIGNYIFHSNRLGVVTVEVRRYEKAEVIRRYERKYNNYSSYEDNVIKRTNGDDFADHVEILISVASCDSPNVAGKIYRRALACVLNDWTVYFMTDL